MMTRAEWRRGVVIHRVQALSLLTAMQTMAPQSCIAAGYVGAEWRFAASRQPAVPCLSIRSVEGH